MQEKAAMIMSAAAVTLRVDSLCTVQLATVGTANINRDSIRFGNRVRDFHRSATVVLTVGVDEIVARVRIALSSAMSVTVEAFIAEK